MGPRTPRWTPGFGGVGRLGILVPHKAPPPPSPEAQSATSRGVREGGTRDRRGGDPVEGEKRQEGEELEKSTILDP